MKFKMLKFFTPEADHCKLNLRIRLYLEKEFLSDCLFQTAIESQF